MDITEKDLFNYVFYRDTLSEDKVKYLKNTDMYKDEIDFFSSLKNSISGELSAEVKNKLTEKIPEYKNDTFQVIVLYPVIEKSKRKKSDRGLVLAADSAELKQQQVSQTFSDDKKEYLVKLISSESETKIFVFSTSENELRNIRIKLHPNEKEYFLKDSSNPLEVNESVIAESISLEFSNLQG